ncbi:MAG: methyl-accepting chemotaxis sensory transducer with cache sensor [Clostridiaceae bacterium]|jgi:methyl-accepting chemotaxis protein|nr:methyl-accepting chemotaxis sensory transducer with cache sensor [Clostridiaceae bacterium]
MKFISLFRLKSKGRAEIANIEEGSNSTIENIKTSIAGVKNTSQKIDGAAVTLNSTSEQMVTAANEVATAVQEVAKGASEQANELMDVVNLLSNLSDQINEVDNKLNTVKDRSLETENMATNGTNIINGLVQSIVDVKGSFDTVMEKVKGLSQSVSKIGHITDIINSISEQTNLLALNAAIEAARAGEQGRGFAVVADEIRKLAEQSKNSSTEIISLVKSVTAETEDVIVNSNNLNDLIESQAISANDTIISFEDIKTSVKSIPAVIEDTHNSLGNAIEAKNVVLNKVQNVSAVAEEVSASSEEISASSEEMLSSAEEVSNLATAVQNTSMELNKEVSVLKF